MNEPFKKSRYSETFILHYDRSEVRHLNNLNAGDGFSWISVRG